MLQVPGFIRPHSCVARQATRTLLKWGLESEVKFFIAQEMSQISVLKETYTTSVHHKRESDGFTFQPLDEFYNFSETAAILTVFGSRFACFRAKWNTFIDKI